MACGTSAKFSPFDRGAPKPGAPTGSLSLIFHFSFGGSNVVGHEACSEGYVWDAIFQKCHPVFTCDAGAKFQSGLCPADEEERDSDDPSELAKNGTLVECDRVVLQQDEFSMLDNGSILLNVSMRQVPPSEFSQLDDARVAVCADSVPGLTSDAEGGQTSFSPLEGTLSLICTIVSLVGLALHLIVLAAVPRMRNLPGLISMGISASLMAAQILFLVATSPAMRPPELAGCVALAAVLHFAFLSVFAWTAVMSYDIWRTFSHPTGHIGNRKSHNRKMQFLRLVFYNCITKQF
jgi:7 transmembrane receptor (Secretin family)